MADIKIKICGLSEPNTLTAAIEGGADFIGLVFYPPSTRHVEIETARYLCSYLPNHVQAIALMVNPSDKDIETTLTETSINMIQLHGDETPQRVEEIKEKFDLSIMKALSVCTEQDLSKAEIYADIVDWLLFDAKGDILPGGNGVTFDWNILKKYSGKIPWMLAGGLTPENVAQAIEKTTPYGVDVSSGVESAPGIKETQKIHSFIQAVKKA